MHRIKNGVGDILAHWHSFRLKLIIEGIVIGALVGMLIVLYRYLLELTGEALKRVYQFLLQKPGLIPVWLIILLGISYLVGIMIKREPMIKGSGIPQVEGVLMRRLNMNWWKVIIGKFIGGVLAIGSGLSLGREGPSVQLGAAVGQGFSRIFKRIRIEEKYLITSGASAGLSAAFNAPLAGVIFALEEVHKSFSPLILLSAMSASLTADFVSKEFFGLKPVFDFNMLTPLPLNYYGYIIFLGVIVGCLGMVFTTVLIKVQDVYSEQKWIPVEFRPMVPFAAAGILGLLLPQVLGGGHELINSLVTGSFALKLLLLLVVVKFLFTMISFGSGVPGGIFLPMLVIGALIGDIYGNILVQVFHIQESFVINFIIFAMAGYFTAVVKAPVTGSILITEMTGSFHHLLALVIVSITAYVVTDLLHSKPVYELLLERILDRSDSPQHKSASVVKSKIILEIPVCIGTVIDGKKIKKIDWPEDVLLVGIKRGDKEILPKGNTMIYGGDYLIALVSEEHALEIKEELLKLASSCILDNGS